MNDVQARNAQVADLWSSKLDGGTAFSPETYWLAVPAVVRHFTRGATRGHREDSWVNDCVLRHLAGRTPMERILSVGCGTGALERHLALMNAFRDCDAWDISPGAVDTARRLASEAGCRGIHYEVRDANQAEIPEAVYDSVWFNSSLHHVEALEAVCEAVARSLKPGGWLILNEYVGPSVFDLPPRQKQAIRAAFDLIPARLRRRRAPDGSTEIARAPAIPCPAEVAADDPSEAVRSADILEIVGHYFDLVEVNQAGGTILQFLLQDIAGNFREDDPESMKVLDLLIGFESALIEAGDLASDFAVVVARRRETPSAPLPPKPALRPGPPPDPLQASAHDDRTEADRAEIERLHATIRQMASSRAWRAAGLYWRLLRRFRPPAGPG